MSFLDTYKKNGYALLPGYLDREQVKAIKSEAQSIFMLMLRKNGIPVLSENDQGFADALFELFRTNYADFIGAARAAQHILSMHRFAVSDQIMNLLKEIGLAIPILCVKPIIYFNSRNLAKVEGHFKTPAHQDWRSMQGSLNSVVIWVPLVDVDVNLGAIEFIPGSHLNGLAPTEKDEWFRHIPDIAAPASDFVAEEVRVGDLVVFSAFATHRSGNNVTNAIRWSIHVRYNDANEATFMHRGMPHPYAVYRPEQELITQNFPSVNQIVALFA
jgi:ectoine hydroxylase-related dioxygenase (phytanoyl-CoA dioxygenase family)